MWSEEIVYWLPGGEHDRADYDIPCEGWYSATGVNKVPSSQASAGPLARHVSALPWHRFAVPLLPELGGGVGF